MRVYLKVNAGPHAGRRIDLKNGQSASFGNTDWADYCFQNDRGMKDVHFRLTIDPGRCRLTSLQTDSPTRVNGEEVDEIGLNHGDLIEAGQSAFEVAIEAPPWEPAEESELDETEEREQADPVDLPALADFLELSPPAQALAAEEQQLSGWLAGLIEQKLWADAIRLVAHLLPAPVAMKWIVEAVDPLLGNSLIGPQQAAFESARAWAAEPSEPLRREAGQQAKSVRGKGLGGAVAMAAFCSEGSITPEGFENVPPEPRVTGRLLMAAAMIAVGSRPPAQREDDYRSILEQAPKIPGTPIQLP